MYRLLYNVHAFIFTENSTNSMADLQCMYILYFISVQRNIPIFNEVKQQNNPYSEQYITVINPRLKKRIEMN